MTKEREVRNIEEKEAEEIKLRQSQETETQNVHVCCTYIKADKNLVFHIIQKSFRGVTAEIIDLIKNKNHEGKPFTVKETQYDFVDPCPKEMKQVIVKLFYNSQNRLEQTRIV